MNIGAAHPSEPGRMRPLFVSALLVLPWPAAAQDRDLDLVPDASDACPDAGETHDGVADADGCPEEGDRPFFTFGAGELTPSERVRFRTEHDEIEVASFPLLELLAAILLAHPELGTLSVEGHMSRETWEERADMSSRLWRQRAAEVVDFLVSRGVPAARLVASDRLTDAPVCDPSTARGRRARRRCRMANDRIVLRFISSP